MRHSPSYSLTTFSRFFCSSQLLLPLQSSFQIPLDRSTIIIGEELTSFKSSPRLWDIPGTYKCVREKRTSCSLAWVLYQSSELRSVGLLSKPRHDLVIVLSHRRCGIICELQLVPGIRIYRSRILSRILSDLDADLVASRILCVSLITTSLGHL